MQDIAANVVHFIGESLPCDDNEGDSAPSRPRTGFDETYRPRPLACKQCGWIIGVVMRVKKTTTKVRRLWVFTFARDANTIPPTVQLQSPHWRSLFRVHGMDQCDGVECTHCGELTPWSMSMEAYLRLLNYYQRSSRGMR